MSDHDQENCRGCSGRHFVASNACAEQIPLERSGGVYTLPVLINNVITLKIVLDSGAAEVSMPLGVALTLNRASTIDDNNFLEDKTYMLADGRCRRTRGSSSVGYEWGAMK